MSSPHVKKPRPTAAGRSEARISVTRQLSRSMRLVLWTAGLAVILYAVANLFSPPPVLRLTAGIVVPIGLVAIVLVVLNASIAAHATRVRVHRDVLHDVLIREPEFLSMIHR